MAEVCLAIFRQDPFIITDWHFYNFLIMCNSKGHIIVLGASGNNEIESNVGLESCVSYAMAEDVFKLNVLTTIFY